MKKVSQNPYEILGVSRHAEEEEIQAAWAKALKQARRKGEYSIEEINSARDILLDKKQRILLDLELFPQLSRPDLTVELPVIPQTPSLQWFTTNFKWNWDQGLDSLSTYFPDIDLPDIAELWKQYKKPGLYMTKQPVEEWLIQYMSEKEEPWKDEWR